MKPFHLFPTLVATLFLAACGGTHLPSGVNTVSIAGAARQAPQVLAPPSGTYFARMAEGESAWALTQLKATLAREIAATQRFHSATPGRGDAEITVETMRHGLIELSGGSYAVSVTATVSIRRGDKSLGTRELDGTGGSMHTLREFEDPAVYRDGVQSTLDKLVIEFASTL